MDGTRDYKEGLSQCRPPTNSSLTTSGKCHFVMFGQGAHIESTRRFRCSSHLIVFSWILKHTAFYDSSIGGGLPSIKQQLGTSQIAFASF